MAVHEQSGVVDTVTVPVAPMAGMESVEFFAAIWHFTGDGDSDVSDFEHVAPTNATIRHTSHISTSALAMRRLTRPTPGRRADVRCVSKFKRLCPPRIKKGRSGVHLVSALEVDHVSSCHSQRFSVRSLTVRSLDSRCLQSLFIEPSI